MSRSFIQHFSHEHTLYKKRSDHPALCNLCCHQIPTYEVHYRCDLCCHRIHVGCAAWPEHIIDHSLHPLHCLKLTRRSSNVNVISCYYCEKPFQNDDEYVYACDQLCSDFYMHRTCAAIPLPAITASNVDGCNDHGVVHFACHQRLMALVDQQHHSKKRGATCLGCQSTWSGHAYTCVSEECKTFLHKSCAELPQKIQHPFHSSHSLTLQVSKPRSCHSCCKKDCRLIFSCHEDGCDFVLCTKCAFLDITPVKCRSHDHLLFLVDNSLCKIQCYACQKSYEDGVEGIPNEVNHMRSFIFRCMNCDFNFHFLCGPLPSTIKSKHHMHPLVLSKYSFLKDNSDGYFCDVYEEERDQSFRIYQCEECKYAAHIHCLICEIRKAIKGDAKDLELKAVGENRWDLLENMDHQPEESSNQSSLKDITDMLTEEEKKMLMDPFGFDFPPVKFLHGNAYDAYRQLNSFLDHEGTIEDIHKIRRFFHLNMGRHADYIDLKMELDSFTPQEGLLTYLDDKNLRQNVVDVSGYMVPETLAPILKTFLRKYGRNLRTKFESLRPATQSITCTSLCIVIDKMCRTEIEHVTWDDIKHWYFYLDGIEEITGLKLPRYSDSLFKIIKAFLGFEAIRYEKGIREKLEAEMEICKKNLEKLKEDTSDMSDFMEECSHTASEWKQRTWGDEWF